MDYCEAELILDQIRDAARRHAPIRPFEKDLIQAAVRYARLRVDWALLPDRLDGDPLVQERKRLDDTRTRAHDAFIDTCNILSRQMRDHELPAEWRRELGDHRTVEGRKRIGDFACYIHYVLGIDAR